MIPLSSIVGLFGCTMLPIAVAVAVLRRWPLSLTMRIAVVLSPALMGLFPVDGIPAAAHLRGVVGDLSITSLVLLFSFLSSYVLGHCWLKERDQRAFIALLAVTALIFYPMALGIGYFDPYALGYGSSYFLLSLLMVALAAWYLTLHLVVATIVLSAASYLGDVLESDNLWDYLIDPLASVYALIRLPAIVRMWLMAHRVDSLSSPS